jgi:hypothetical protein
MDEMMHTSHKKEPRNLSKESSNSTNKVEVAVKGPDNPVRQGPDNPPPKKIQNSKISTCTL